MQIRMPRCVRARRARCSPDSPPPGCAISTHHRIGNKTLTGLLESCSGPWTRAPARNATRGAVNSPAPPLPCPDPGSGSHLPLGPASRCRRASGARPPRALPGEKEKPCGRSARAHSPPPLRRTAGGEAGAGGERRGPQRRWGRNLPNSPARLRGEPGKQAGEQPVGAALLEQWGDGGAPVPGHQLLSGRPGPRSRRLRGSAPPIPPASPLEKKLGVGVAGE